MATAVDRMSQQIKIFTTPLGNELDFGDRRRPGMVWQQTGDRIEQLGEGLGDTFDNTQ